MATIERARVPWHLWVIGLVSLLWNCYGAYDYVMTETGDVAYFESMGFGAEELAYMERFPTWAVAVWAIGVWGSLLGSILLLLRSRHAATAFLVSLIGAAVSFAYQLSLDDKPASMAGGMAAVMPIVILIAIVAQWYYARRMTAQGVLR